MASHQKVCLFLTLWMLICTITASIRVVSLNMNGRLNQVANFKRKLSGEHVICLQEVNDVRATRNKYKEYPYMHHITNTARRGKKNSIMILSKVPFQGYATKLIQTDPGGDRWNRNAQYVTLKTNSNKIIHLFHYHNTYNWHKENSKYERQGVEKFVNWIKQSRGVGSLGSASNIIVAGDFNYASTSPLSGLVCSQNWVDFVCSSIRRTSSGYYATRDGISDVHNAPWAKLSTTVNIGAVVGRKVRIFNTYQNEYMYAAGYKPFDNDRRRVFTWRPGNRIREGYWRLEPEGRGTYRIFNTYYLEYMYAASYKPYDNDRRRVFTWRNGVPVNQGIWKLSGSGDNQRIYNTYHKEYLYAGDYAPFDGSRRRVFSWRQGNPVKQGRWRIEYV